MDWTEEQVERLTKRHGPRRAYKTSLPSVPEKKIREMIQEWIDDIPGRTLSGLVRWTQDVSGLTRMESGFFGVSFRELIPVLQKLEEEELEASLVRVPRLFYEDHENRMLPTPPTIKERVHHVWIERDHPAVPELLSDASYYSDPFGPEVEDSFSRNLRASAQKTVLSLEEES